MRKSKILCFRVLIPISGASSVLMTCSADSVLTAISTEDYSLITTVFIVFSTLFIFVLLTVLAIFLFFDELADEILSHIQFLLPGA